MLSKKLNESSLYFDLVDETAEPVPNFRFFKFFLYESLIVRHRVLQSFTENNLSVLFTFYRYLVIGENYRTLSFQFKISHSWIKYYYKIKP